MFGYKNIFPDLIGYIEIAKINIKIPIYPDTTESVLQKGAGHLVGSSLPIGGKNTHAVISAHCGSSYGKLFTDLNKLEKGDTFNIKILNKSLVYRVDRILVVAPNDFSKLNIIKDKDYVTLTTCTPYGINTHRLLVRGYRIK